MLASIHPLGERSRSNRWWLTVTTYVLGSVGGGALVGALAATLGRLVLGPLELDLHSAAALAATAAVATAAVDAALVPVSVPTVRRQVDEDWLHRYRGWVYGVGFGFQLGTGVMTTVVTASVYLAFALAAISGSWQAGLVIGASLGAGRSMLLVAGAHVRTPAHLHELHRRLNAWGRPSGRLTILTEIAASIVMAATAVRALWHF